MNKSTFLIAIAIAGALAGGFWLGRSRASAATSPVQISSQEEAPARHLATSSGAVDHAPAPRDYANESAIADSTSTPGQHVMAQRFDVSSDMKLPPPPPRPASPTENHLLSTYGLRYSDMKNVMASPHYGELIDRLSGEASADSLEMTRIYRDYLSASMKSDPRFQVDRMACGAHVCVLTARGPVGQDEAFGNFLTSDWKNPKNPKVYAVMPASLPPVGNSATTEYRLIFTIDPKFNAFEGP